MAPEAPFEQTGSRARARRRRMVRPKRSCGPMATPRGARGTPPLRGSTDFPQVGFTLFVLWPGEPIGMYHWEADQEDFLGALRRGSADRRGRGTSVAPVGLRPLPRRDASTSSSEPAPGPAPCWRSARVSIRRAPTGAATRWTRPRSPWRRGRGDDRRGAGLRPVSEARAHAIPGRLAPELTRQPEPCHQGLRRIRVQ